jgi:2-dehydro-3-deoxyphosphogluconate aldolase/(4S)-4-hydroxy-2-oxoglutarate aldolase
VEAGARFLVSPVLDPAVMETARELEVPHVPSGLTPTELFAAHRAGAPLVKLFPAAAVGPDYLGYLRGPLPDIRVMPTGGLTPDTALDWIRAGSVAVGMGGALCPTTMSEVPEAARAAADLLRRIDAARAR